MSGLLPVNNYSGWLQMKNGGGLPRRTTVVGDELQVENYSDWLQMKNGGGLPQGTTVVSFRWRTTTTIGPRWTVVGFKWRTLVGDELQVENNSGWLQMKNGGGFPRRTTVVS